LLHRLCAAADLLERVEEAPHLAPVRAALALRLAPVQSGWRRAVGGRPAGHGGRRRGGIRVRQVRPEERVVAPGGGRQRRVRVATVPRYEGNTAIMPRSALFYTGIASMDDSRRQCRMRD
jgi:hypothetical protein